MPKRSGISFTDAFVRSKAIARNGTRTSYFDRETPGLELRVAASGVKAWAFRYRDVAGRTRRHSLGQYPAISLKDARELAFDARRSVSRGGDPQAEKQTAIAEAKAQRVRTVGDLVEEYLAVMVIRNRASTIAVDRQRMKTHILPKLKNVPMERVTRTQVRELINDIGARGHGVTANRVAALIGRLYRFANNHLDMTLQNPAKGLQNNFKEKSRERVLSDSELKGLWTALDNPVDAPSPLSESMALCLKLCGLTLQRAGEVCGIHQSEIDLVQRVWVIPSSRSKNKREHIVPLSDPAMRVVERALEHNILSSFLFPSPRSAEDGSHGSITRHAVTRAMARLVAALEIPKAGPHDLRRTGATNITSERIGMPRFIVSLVLGHISETGGVTGVYDRNAYLAEKRRALDAWGKLVAEICGNETEGSLKNIIEFQVRG